MDEEELGSTKAPLMRAQLHIRSAKRRLDEGKTQAAIGTYFDALLYAMLYFCQTHKEDLGLDPKKTVEDPQEALELLEQYQVLPSGFDFFWLESITEESLYDRYEEYDQQKFIEMLNLGFNALEITPFDESVLPPENPEIY